MDEEDCAGLPCRVETWCSDPLWDPSVSWDTQVRYRTTFDLTLNLMLKVPSGQIGSACEWYHWIGLEKDINRYRILIL